MEDNDPIKEKAEKEAKELWEKELKKDFIDHIQKCLMETLKELKQELKQFDESMKTHIKTLDEKFENQFKEQYSLILGQFQNNQNSAA